MRPLSGMEMLAEIMLAEIQTFVIAGNGPAAWTFYYVCATALLGFIVLCAGYLAAKLVFLLSLSFRRMPGGAKTDPPATGDPRVQDKNGTGFGAWAVILLPCATYIFWLTVLRLSPVAIRVGEDYVELDYRLPRRDVRVAASDIYGIDVITRSRLRKGSRDQWPALILRDRYATREVLAETARFHGPLRDASAAIQQMLERQRPASRPSEPATAAAN